MIDFNIDKTYNEQLIIDYFIQEKSNLKKQSTRYISKQLGVSPATIVRLCKKLGFSGYEDFKENYLLELSNKVYDLDLNEPISKEDKNIEIADKIADLYQEVIQDTLHLLTHDKTQQAISMIHKAASIYIVSMGTSIDIAYSFKEKMLKIGKLVYIEEKVADAYALVNSIPKDSLFIFLSYTGNTEALMRVAKKAYELKLPILSITTHTNNTLEKYSSLCLYVPSKEKLVSSQGNYTMNISTMYLLDVLYSGFFNIHNQLSLNKKIKNTRGFETKRKSTKENLNN